MDSNGDCLGVVLAGGQSQRMGTDKARLRWDGVSLVERALAALRASGCARTLVSGDYPDHPHIVDRFPGCGPLGGLASIAEVAPESRWLVLAVDQPLVDASLLRPLLDGLQVGVARARQVCRYGEEPLPMAMSVTPETRDWLRAAVSADAGRRSLKALQERLRVHALTADAAVRARLRGANTPAEWQSLTLPG